MSGLPSSAVTDESAARSDNARIRCIMVESASAASASAPPHSHDGMSVSVAHHCPDCKAEINPDLRSCDECGADVGVWPESQRMPLILPGSPAFSADVVRKRASVPKLAAGTLIVAAVVGAVLYYMPEKISDEVAAIGPTAIDGSRARRDESLGASVSGDTPLTRPVPRALDIRSREPASATPAIAARVPANRTTPATTSGRIAAVARPPGVVAPSAGRPDRRLATASRNAVSATPPRPVITPVLAIIPVVSNTLRPGERLQLRWSVTDRRTGRALPRAIVEFTSTDASVASVNVSTGLVTARLPGTTRIIIDGELAGRSTIALTVRTPAASPLVTIAPGAAADLSRIPVAAAPASATPVPAPVRNATGATLPDAGEVRTVVERFIRDVRRDAVRNYEVTQFLADGADHRVVLSSGPTVLSTTGMGVRVSFELRFMKYDGGGRPMTRIASVTMDVDKRDGQSSSSAINIGGLRRP